MTISIKHNMIHLRKSAIFLFLLLLCPALVCAQPDASVPGAGGAPSFRRPELQPMNPTPPQEAFQEQMSSSTLRLKNDPATAGSEGVMLDILDLKNIDILDVLKLISQKSGINIIASQNVTGRVTVYLKGISVKEALRIIVEAYGWAYVNDGEILKVMTAAEYQAKYGQKFGHQTETVVKQLLFATTPDVVAVLNQVKSETGKVIPDQKTGTMILMDAPDKIDEMMAIIKRLDVPIKSEVFQLSYAKADAIGAKIAETVTPEVGSMKFDERSNRIVVKDTPQKLEEIKRIIEAFDRKDREVLIEAKILQVVLSDEYKLGIDWEAIVSDYQEMTFNSEFSILGSTDKRGSVSIGSLQDDDYTVLIEALDTVGVTNILSSPRIMAVNNQEAKILVGSTEPYVTSTTTTPASGPTTTSETVNFIDVGVKLFVTPTIHEDDFISMKIKPEVSTVTRSITTGNNNTIPVVETSEAETVITVKDGVTVVIGGLIKDEKVKETKKVPLLGDIPYLGQAFRSESDEVTKNEIAIFLTPRIVTGDIEEDLNLGKYF